MNKQFLFSLLAGGILGLALIGYSVFAVFQPPTAAPPAANVAAPINVSNTSQSKGAGLVVNSNNINVTGLRVYKYLQLDTVAGVPSAGDCDATAAGRMIVDTTNSRLYVCVSSAWKWTTLN